MGSPVEHIVAAWCSMFTIATTLVIMRTIARLKGPMRRLGVDDWLLIGSWTCLTAYMIGWIVLVGRFRPQDGGLPAMFKLGREHMESFLKGLYIIPSIGYIGVLTAKFSILASYWSIFDGIRSMKPYLIAMAVFLGISEVALLSWRLFGCVPISANWSVDLLVYDATTTDGSARTNRCILTTLLPSMDVLYGVGIITDLGLAAFAVPLLRMTKLSRSDAIGVFLTFSLVGLTIAASTIREVVVNTTGGVIAGATWSFVEVSSCVAVASLIGLRSTFGQLVRWTTDKFRKRRGGEKDAPRHSYASSVTMACKGPSDDTMSMSANTVSCRSSASAGMLEELRKLQREEEDVADDAKTVRTLSIVVGKSVTIEESLESLPQLPPPSRTGSIISGHWLPGTPSYGW